MPRRSTPDVDKEFDVKLKTVLKNKSLADVQQLLRSKLQVRRVVAKKCVLPSAADDCLLLAMLMGYNSIIESLLKIGVNVNAADDAGESVLFKAVNDGNHTIVKLLLQHGADATIVGKKAKYPLQVAVEHGDVTTVSLLLDAGADANHLNKHGESVLFEAIRKENLSLVQLLLSHGADANYTFDDKKGRAATTYALAIKVNKPGIVDALVSHGVKKCEVKTLYPMLVYNTRVDSTSNHGCEKYKEKGALFKAACVGSNILVKQLLECGTDVNSTETDWRKRTALLPACERCDVDMIKLLLDHGADVNHQVGRCCEAPLFIVIQSENVHVDAVRVLLDHSADLKRKGAKTPLISAIREDCSIDIIRLLLDHGADVNECDAWHSPLYYAADKDYSIEVVRLLLERGADVNQEIDKSTPLFQATLRFDVDTVRLLLDYGADVNRGSCCCTPLSYACRYGYMKLKQLLLSRSNSRSTPLLCAISAANVNIVRHILSTGADANVSTSGYFNHALKTAAFALEYSPPKDRFEAISEIIAIIIGRCDRFEYYLDWEKEMSWFPPHSQRPETCNNCNHTCFRFMLHKHTFFEHPISCLLPCLDAELQFSSKRLSCCRMLLGHGASDRFSCIFNVISYGTLFEGYESTRELKAESDALSRSFVRVMILAGVDFSGIDALRMDEDFKEYAEYLAMVKEEVELMSLQDSCVIAVRKYLSGGDMWTKVDLLPLPKPLQDLLKLTNV